MNNILPCGDEINSFLTLDQNISPAVTFCISGLNEKLFLFQNNFSLLCSSLRSKQAWLRLKCASFYRGLQFSDNSLGRGDLVPRFHLCAGWIRSFTFLNHLSSYKLFLDWVSEWLSFICCAAKLCVDLVVAVWFFFNV